MMQKQVSVVAILLFIRVGVTPDAFAQKTR
jgi:hypothetical protein